MNRRAVGLVATGALAAGLLGSAPSTLARFGDSATVTGTFGTRTLHPPTDLTGTGGTAASLSWTPSTSGWATGYEVLRSATPGSGYGLVGDVTPITASSSTDAPGDGTWYYVLRSYAHNWTSDRSNEVALTVGAPTPSFVDCAAGSNAPVTVDAGDNDGYERSPDNACAEDGAVATDGTTGTSTTNSCTSSAKDRHDFWGYPLGLPASVTSIDGITVRPVAGQSNNGGTSWLCVQLSWDGGASWTGTRRVTLATSALTAYTLGGPADTWGHAWSVPELDAATLRVRVINSSSHPNKQIRLDAIQVSVSYTP